MQILDERLNDAADGVKAALAELVPPPIEEVVGSDRAGGRSPVTASGPWRGPLIAAGTAVVILVVAAVSALILIGDRGDVFVELEPTNTVAPTTTVPGTTPEPMVPLPGDGPVYGVGQAAIATDGDLWTVTERAVVRWDLETGAASVFVGTDGLPSDAPRLLNEWRQGIGPAAVDPDGTLWIAEGMNLLLRSDAVNETSIALPRGMMASPWANALAVAPDGTVWAAPNHEPYVFAYDGTSWTVFDESDGVPAMPFSVAIAPDGAVWVGSTGIYGDPDGNVLPTGVARFDGTSWTQYTTNEGLLSNDASVVVGPDGTVWLIHHGLSPDLAAELGVDPLPRGLSRFDGNAWTTYPDVAVSGSAVVGTDGTLWMALDESLVGFDGTNTIRYDAPLDAIDAATESAAAESAAARAQGTEFAFGEHSLCDWFTPDEFTAIVTDAYTTHGITPIPNTAGLDCEGWPTESDSLTMLEILSPYQEQTRALSDPGEEWYTSDPEAFEPYDGLDPSIRVRNLSRGCTAYIPGIDAELRVDGHDETLSFGHFMPREFSTPGGCDEGVVNPVGLAIAESMLRDLGWIDDSQPGEPRQGTQGG